jgi:elongation factor 1-beta
LNPNHARFYRSAAAPAAAAEEEDDDIDLFGSDDEEVDDAAEKLKAQRLAEYAAKKANKPKTIAKTTVTLEVKPWDDETSMEELTAAVKAIEMDGLVWGGSQLVAIGYGIKKLQINCVVEDDKVCFFVFVFTSFDFLFNVSLMANGC